ncbi:DUF819 family protein [Catalinimonas sp. 4WD22]|uniref:DUF819 family protein n=1 Tax=Catalinimonas locisalis TaxID=3133978 RepID=UPI0031011048
MLFAAALGMVGERRRWFGKISGIIVTISFTILLVSLGIIPSASNPDISVPVYDLAFTYIIPLAIPLLLFNVNLRKMIGESGRLLKAFLLGTVGICTGVIISAWVFPMGQETYKLAAVFSATYIGGGVNFFAVADALDFLKSPLFPAAVAIDNVFTNFYIMFLFFLPGWKLMHRLIPKSHQEKEKAWERPTIAEKTVNSGYDMLLMERICVCLLITSAIAAFSIWLAPFLETWLNTDVKLEILLITILIVMVSNFFPKTMARLEPVAFQLGFFLVFVFLAVVGAASDVNEIIAASPFVLGFVILSLLIHLSVMLLGARLLNISLEELSIASAANIGGSATSAPMATTFGLKKAITPAVLIGTLGNVIGTFIGIGIGLLLR